MIEARGPSFDFICAVHISVMATIGRWLQIAGLVALPLSIILQLQNSITSGQMLLVLVASACMFGIGRIIEGYARQ
jgi:hypothetical protein